MRMLFAPLAALCLLALGACGGELKTVALDPQVQASAKLTAGSIVAASPKLTKVAAKIDTAIAKGSSEASAYCGFVRLAQGAAKVDGAVTLGSKQSHVANDLTNLAGQLCDHPPQNLPDLRAPALATINDATALGWL